MEIKIKLNDMKYRYDVYQMFNIYFPLDEIKFLDDGDYIVNKIVMPLNYNGTMQVMATKAPLRIY